MLWMCVFLGELDYLPSMFVFRVYGFVEYYSYVVLLILALDCSYNHIYVSGWKLSAGAIPNQFVVRSAIWTLMLL